MVVIPNGFDVEGWKPDPGARVDVRRELDLPLEAPLIGLISRFDPVKDHRTFLSAALLLLKRLPNVHFLLCGGGVTWENSELSAWIRSSGAASHFRLVGEREDIPRLTAALDLASLSSYTEGFPNVIGEAMACGIPCVTTDVGDAAYIVGETGRVVPPRQAEALAEAWRELIEAGPERRAALGAAARRRVAECFDLAGIARRYEGLYRDVVRSPRSSPVLGIQSDAIERAASEKQPRRSAARVSVVSTVYNGEAYFDRCVPGILGQSLRDFEWVIVDDGSDDATPRLLADLAARDSRVRIVSPGRLGRARALNLGVAEARCEYVANQDFDDMSYPDRLRLEAAFLDANPNVGVLGSHYVVVDQIRSERYQRLPPSEHDAIVRTMANRIPLAHTLVMFRKQAWTQVGGYPDVDNLEDYLLWIAIVASGWRVANLPEVLGEHYVHRTSFFSPYRSAVQRQMTGVQARAIRELGLPRWMYIYPMGRFVYGGFPNPVKRFARRILADSKERDL